MSQFHQEQSARTRGEATVEDIHLRNYDMETAHRVWVNVVADGDRVFEKTVRLGPGGTASIDGAIPPGEYALEVGIDGLRREVEHCHIGAGPERTALVEMGNGVVSTTQGLH